MLLIGNKPYNNLKLDNIIDKFDKNIRQNFGMPRIIMAQKLIFNI